MEGKWPETERISGDAANQTLSSYQNIHIHNGNQKPTNAPDWLANEATLGADANDDRAATAVQLQVLQTTIDEHKAALLRAQAEKEQLLREVIILRQDGERREAERQRGERALREEMRELQIELQVERGRGSKSMQQFDEDVLCKLRHECELLKAENVELMNQTSMLTQDNTQLKYQLNIANGRTDQVSSSP